MVLKRLAAAASALALVTGVAHAQTKTPAQLIGASSANPGDLFLIWPIAGQGGPLESVPFSVLQGQIEANLLGSAQTFSNTLTVTGLTVLNGGANINGYLNVLQNEGVTGTFGVGGISTFSGAVNVNAGITANTETVTGGLSVGSITVVAGTNAGVGFYDRTTSADSWLWYATGGVAYFYNGTLGQVLNVNYATGLLGVADGLSTPFEQLTPHTFATLPGSPVDGEEAYITDSPTAAAGNYAATVTVGGGSNHVKLYYDGSVSKWRIG